MMPPFELFERDESCTMAQWTAAHRDGLIAHRAGVARESNPYRRDRGERWAWDLGWRAAAAMGAGARL